MTYAYYSNTVVGLFILSSNHCLILHVIFVMLWTSVNPHHVPGYLQYVLPSRSSMEIHSSVGLTSDQSSRTCHKEILYAFLLINFIQQNFLEKLHVTWLVMKFPAFNGTSMFITMFTRSTTSPHSEPSEPLHILWPYFFRPTLMYVSHLHLGLGLQRGASS